MQCCCEHDNEPLGAKIIWVFLTDIATTSFPRTSEVREVSYVLIVRCNRSLLS